MRARRSVWLVSASVVMAACGGETAQQDESPETGGTNTSGGANGAGTTSFGGSAGISGASAGTVNGGAGLANGGSAAAGGSGGSGGATAGAAGGGMGGSSGGANGGGSATAGAGAGSAGAAAGVAGQAGTTGTAPTFTDLWNRTLENGCATPYCHDGSGKGWSGFDKTTAYRTLVGAASTSCPGETRVVAGDPAKSVLAAALSHTDLGTCDVPTMPRNRAKLAQADIDRIIAWIRAGARND